MKNSKILFLLSCCLFILISCNRIQGRIDQRKNAFFLVNDSKSDVYRFTVKKTEIQDDSLFSYSTQLITVAPGDEKYLSEISKQSDIEYPIIEKSTISIWKPVKVTKEMIEKDIKKIEKEKREGVHNPYVLSISQISIDKQGIDTIINGEKMKYKYIIQKNYDRKNPLPIKKVRYEYKVTGQILIKE